MQSYANVSHGIHLLDGEKCHYYQLQSSLHGQFSYEKLLEFLEKPQRHGEPLPDIVIRLFELYDLSGRHTKLSVYNISPTFLKDCRTWEEISGKFHPLAEIDSRGVRVLKTPPMNISTDQVSMIERMARETLRVGR